MLTYIAYTSVYRLYIDYYLAESLRSLDLLYRTWIIYSSFIILWVIYLGYNTIYSPEYDRFIIMERINGEIITGIALAFMAILFIYAGTVNAVWATIIPADFLILAIGGAFIILGMWTIRKNRSIKKEHSHYWCLWPKRIPLLLFLDY